VAPVIRFSVKGFTGSEVEQSMVLVRLRNKAYHSEADTWDRLNYEKMADVVKGVFAVVMALAR